MSRDMHEDTHRRSVAAIRVGAPPSPLPRSERSTANTTSRGEASGNFFGSPSSCASVHFSTQPLSARHPICRGPMRVASNSIGRLSCSPMLATSRTSCPSLSQTCQTRGNRPTGSSAHALTHTHTHSALVLMTLITHASCWQLLASLCKDNIPCAHICFGACVLLFW
jgi:hypothetical protein